MGKIKRDEMSLPRRSARFFCRDSEILWGLTGKIKGYSLLIDTVGLWLLPGKIASRAMGKMSDPGRPRASGSSFAKSRSKDIQLDVSYNRARLNSSPGIIYALIDGPFFL